MCALVNMVGPIALKRMEPYNNPYCLHCHDKVAASNDCYISAKNYIEKSLFTFHLHSRCMDKVFNVNKLLLEKQKKLKEAMFDARFI
jgi:hypothetical protein